jgi:hypothetical protein
MPTRYRQQLRQLLLLSLMVFTLTGVQLVQASALHNHTQHTVDCALCHLQFSDDALVQHQINLAFQGVAAPVAPLIPELYVSANPSPYQGRAPPCFFS